MQVILKLDIFILLQKSNHNAFIQSEVYSTFQTNIKTLLIYMIESSFDFSVKYQNIKYLCGQKLIRLFNEVSK